MIRSIGATPFGQTSTHFKQRVQSQMPPSSSFRAFSRSSRFPSRGSSVNRQALASAAGPMKLESTSRTVQSETQMPHMMQFIDVTRFSIDSFEAVYSPCSGTKLGCRYGSTRLIWSKNVSSDTTRSRTTCWLPMGSIVSCSPLGESDSTRVLQTSLALPLTRIPHDPQIEARQAQRIARVPSSCSRTSISASSTVESGCTSTSYSCHQVLPPESVGSNLFIFRLTCI